MNDNQTEEHLYPLYAQKQAQKMLVDKNHWHEKVLFTLITPVFPPAECVWVDVLFGFFAIKGKEKTGFVSIRDLPVGTLILNQRYEDGE